MNRILLSCLVAGILVACNGNDGEPNEGGTLVADVTRVAPELTVVSILGDWSSGADMRTPRAEVASAVIDGKIYVVGGFTANGQNSDVVEVYDPAADTWSDMERMPEQLDHAMAASAGEALYVIGGWRVFGDQVSEAVYRYDPGTEAWSSVRDMPLPRAAAAAVTIGERVYVFGGVGPEAEVPLVYDPATDAWSRLAPMPEPREHLAAAAFGGKAYVIGGRWSDRGNVDTAAAYDPATDTWRDLPAMLTARGGLTAAAAGSRIHVTGGESFGEGSRTFDEHEVYDTATDTWSTEAPLPTARHGLASQGVGSRLYVIAGGETPGLSVSGIVEVFEP